MKPSAAYIVPQDSILNPTRNKLFDNFSADDSILLRTTLYLNLIENFLKEESKIDFYCYLDESDKEFLSDEFKQDALNLSFIDLANKNLLFENLSTKEFSKHNNNIIINSDLIGINLAELQRLNNLLNFEDESLLISKSSDGDIGILGFNNYSAEIFSSLVKSNFRFDDFLSRIKSSSHFIHTSNEVLLIKNIDNFKQLYISLSQKKSIEYCSQKMHEHFTHLFVEYKALLK
jgi:hypothetical protein